MADLQTQMASRYVARDFYVYGTVHSAVNPSTSNTQSILISADSDFQLEKLTFFADIAAAEQQQATLEIPLCTVMITDTGSGRQLMSVAIPVTSLFGTGEIPFVLKQPKIFVARSTVSIAVTNFSAANTYNVRLSFIGSKLFLKQ